MMMMMILFWQISDSHPLHNKADLNKAHGMHVHKGNFFDMNTRIIENCNSGELR